MSSNDSVFNSIGIKFLIAIANKECCQKLKQIKMQMA